MHNSKLVFLRAILTSLFLLVLISCSTYQPILDQNAKYLRVGETKAKKDTKVCTKEADAYLKQYKAKRIAKEAARKAAIGSVVGVATGLIFGNNVKSIARGLAIGAGVGAVTGAIMSAGKGSATPDEIKQRYVSNCLTRKGYSVLGWQ